ncbi:MAG: small multi-drug export protein [Nanoarchaeota archaeon]|nr:small multi-drug export protein [Nanoarchaeota archaeon]MBU4299895.1 small multi-drug export protein [Nanoarchaeota archaeon]MBU4452326.1 small multi-drug export protein [Nanoarchaeota archaeon]MCG2724550.1 small multi-drug export protein [archaeon]
MSELLSFLISYISNPWIIVAILGFLPLTEVRIAILYGLFAGLDHFNLFLVAASANIIEAIALFSLIGNKKAMNWMGRILGKKIEKKIKENRKTFEKYEELALIFLVAVPIPGTGTIISVITANALKLDKKRSFIAICAGILISAAFVMLAAKFFMSLLGSFFR